MTEKVQRAVAVVGVGAVLPDAPNAPTFWENIQSSRYSINEVPDDRWDPDLYFDPDPKTPFKTYSKIGGWARDWTWSPLEWRLPIPPTVSEQMDRTQVWGVVAAREALLDYGYPERPLDPDRTAVVLGNAMGGDRHYLTALRIFVPEYGDELVNAPSFAALPEDVRQAIMGDLRDGLARRLPDITEDTMAGELANITAGRIANLFNFHGPNFVVDAACASAMAAMDAAIEGLEQGDFDAVLTGGVDGNMSASTFVKFSKIGALSATGTRPYGEGADGFVMGEGCGVFLLRRLEDAEASGDHIYAVIRGLGGSSDGKGKGITAPNPIGQKFAVERAWRNAGRVPDTASLIEGHGTSTRVGDVVEVQAMGEVFAELGLPRGSLPLGSVKSNIGHLKAAAGAAGILKAVMALNDKVLPPSLNAERPNPNIDFGDSPLFVNTELQEWKAAPDQVRAAAVSAFGFGGTNFHTVIEEYIPGRIRTTDRTTTYSLVTPERPQQKREPKAPLRGALVVGDTDAGAVAERLGLIGEEAGRGIAPPIEPPRETDLRAPYRVAIDYGDAAELADRTAKALKAIEAGNAAMWKALRNSGIFHGKGTPGLVAFLYTGQGSQYLNMLETLRDTEPIVAEMLAEADRVMEPVLGKPLSEYIYVSSDDPEVRAKADAELRATEITQPAVLAVDEALSRLMDAYGIRPDMVMGHSLGEYGALVAAGALPFEDALEAVAGRGREMSRVSMDDNGLMAAVFAPLEAVERVVESIDGYVVIANINSTKQAVIGGATPAVEEAMQVLRDGGAQVVPLPVSHAFHTKIVAPASEPLKEILQRLRLESPGIPLVANTDGELYPMGPNVASRMVDILGRQIASPVQFIKGLRTLYEAGCRIFVEMGPKRALYGFAEDVLGDDSEVVALYTNHPKLGDLVSFNRGLCGLYAEGLGVGTRPEAAPVEAASAPSVAAPQPVAVAPQPVPAAPAPQPIASAAPAADTYTELGRLFADFLERGAEVYRGGRPATSGPEPIVSSNGPVVVSGAGLGLPGMERVFDEEAVTRILHGGQFIDTIPVRLRQEIVDHHITRLVKSEAGGGHFEAIDSQVDVIKLAGRAGRVDLVEEFGYPAERVDALDRTSALAIGAGLAALRDAGIPLVMSYKTTTTGTSLPDRWMLPEAMRDDTGVIFASAFPGSDAMLEEQARFQVDVARHQRLEELRSLRSRAGQAGERGVVVEELDHRIHDLETELANDPYVFDRKYLFRVVAMGHAQFAEYVGARGPNTQINGACASTTQAVSIAEDWITLGRCRRVVIISGDDVTSDNLMQWIGSGFLAVGAAATDEVVEDAATPFDRRRHGMILGMGAAGIVVEDAESLRERGMQPIVEVVSSITANSAFHGSRLDPDHIRHVMERLVSTAEQRWGIDRHEIAPRTAFVSHETYTPARGGSAQAEVDALRFVFGGSADQIVVTNTKGFTGHAMAAGIEDVVAIKALETGVVPPVPNFKEADPDLGHLKLSQGGAYPVSYALRLGAGFGSQISLTLYRHVPSPLGRHPEPDELGFEYRVVDPGAWNRWLQAVTGYDAPQLEFRGRTVRVRDDGPPARVPAAAPAVAPVARAPRPVAAAPMAPVPSPVTAPPVAAAPPAEATVEEAPAGVETPAEPAGDVVAVRVLEIVAGETGYPPDMLDLDLDLEADLGIDTVKQAEMFAAIRSEFGIERDDALALRDYPTLAAVIGFVYDNAEGLGAPRTAAAASAAAAPAVEAGEDAGEDPVRERVLAIVAGETGYPPDMLDLDLDLEADLGIDTVKQAEMFAAIRSEFGIERDDALALRDYPTLAAVIGFVYDNAEGLGAPRTAAAAAVEGHVAATVAPSGLIAGDDQAAAAIPRRLPTPVLRPDLDLCAPTEVTLGPGSKVLVMLDEGGVGGALVKRLEKDHVDVLAVEGAPSAEELMSRIDAWAGDDRVQGVYWLPALDVEAPVGDMDLIAWKEALRIRVKLLYATMRHLYDQVAEPGTFLVSATRLGGRHGYDDAGPPAPMGGAVTGFTKAYKRERPDALVKAVDFPLSRKTTALAKTLVAETLRDPGAVEVGWQDDRRFTITLTEQPFPDPASGLDLGPESVFVVTGAAGSIVSAITADLARASGGTFHLLDLVPEPDPGDPDVALFATDRDALKRLIFERLKDSGERATPAMVDRELVGIERAAAALDAIHAVEAAGGTVHYHSVNLLDAAAMGSVTGKIAEINGKVDVLLHAGGLEISRALPDKEPGEYDLVFDVKADGWFNLLSGLADVPIAATVAFSSIAGRFGNAGQTDYSAANDLLCKSGLAFRTTRPETSGIATDWTAWGDIGMATRGSIPTVMNAAGIDMLPAVAGIPIVRRELARAAGSRELVVGLRLGTLQEEWDETGGLDVGAVDLDAAATPVMVGDVRGFGIHDGLTVTTQLDPTEQPFLFDHQREGTPILPGVMGVESFAAVAALAFPDRHVTAVEDVEFLAPFKFYRKEPRELTIRARFRADGDDILADCELVGERTLANQQEPQVTTHFTGKVRLASSSPKLRKQTAPGEDAATAAGAGDIYGIFFHGPAYQVLDSAWRSGEGAAGLFSSDLPDDYTPQERTTVTEPRLVELCFQTAGIWEIGSTGTMGLPMHIDRVVPVKGVDRAMGRIFASVRQDEHGFAADVVDESGAVLVTMEGYRTAQIPEAMDDDLVAPLRNAMEDR